MAGRSLDHATLVGHTLGHYRIAEKTGGGGMGVVYKAEGRNVVVAIALDRSKRSFTERDRLKLHHENQTLTQALRSGISER